MRITDGPFEGTLLIQTDPFIDERGSLTRVFERSLFEEFPLSLDWRQESLSRTSKAWTLRGLHIQTPPYVEAKLLQILHGVIRWVLVDLREGSPSFGHHAAIDLDGDRLEGLYVPRGFAHGCLSLTDNCELIIKADNIYEVTHGVGIMWNDVELGVEWGLEGHEPLISAGHKAFKPFSWFRENIGAIPEERSQP